MKLERMTSRENKKSRARIDSQMNRWSKPCGRQITRRVAKVSKKLGVSEQTIYKWHKRFGVMNADEVKQRRQLKTENARLPR